MWYLAAVGDVIRLDSLSYRRSSPRGRVLNLVLVVASQANVEFETTAGCGMSLAAAHHFQKRIAQPLQGCGVGWKCVLPNSTVP